jgi:hypothetical protein
MAPACGFFVAGLLKCRRLAPGIGLWARTPVPACGFIVAGLLKCRRLAPGIGLWELTMAPACKVLTDLRHGQATHQAFSAIFAYCLARSSHSSSIFGRFRLSSGSVEPPIKHFGRFSLIVWLGQATHQAFSAVFAYRLARSGHSSSISGLFCLSSGSVEPPIKHFGPFLLIVWHVAVHGVGEKSCRCTKPAPAA